MFELDYLKENSFKNLLNIQIALRFVTFRFNTNIKTKKAYPYNFTFQIANTQISTIL